MRKLFGIFLLACLIGPFVGTFGFLQYEKWVLRKQIKRAMMAGIDADDLVLLEFSTSEATTILDWKHSREFEYEGEMYDIVYRTERADSIFYHCWHDHEETDLNRQVEIFLALALGQPGENENEEEQIQEFMKLFHAGGRENNQAHKFEYMDVCVPRNVIFCSMFGQSPLVPPPRFT